MKPLSSQLSSNLCLILKNITLIVSVTLIWTSRGYSQSSYVKDEIYIVYKEDIPIFWNSKIHKLSPSLFPEISPYINDFGINEIENSFLFSRNEQLRRTLRVHFSIPESIDSLITTLKKNEKFLLVMKIPMFETTIVPNDPNYSQQWALEHIGTEDAWNITTGTSSIDIAIVDDAIQGNHPDILSNIETGWDVSQNDNTFAPPNSNYFHGTHVAGIAGANTNNNVGVASIGWNIDLIAVKASNGTVNPAGGVMITHGYEGITWAAENGAEIINCSWGAQDPSVIPYAQYIIDNAWGMGAIIVAAAGNDNSSNPFYPAALTNVIAVANSTPSDSRFSGNGGSNYGSWVDVAAPGTDIYSTKINSTYGSFTGTSMASPMACSLLGLIWSVDPNASRESVIDCMLNTASPINWQGGSGRIDAFDAVQCMSNSANGDNCSSPINLTSQTDCNYHYSTVLGATASGLNIPNCNGYTSSTALDLWFEFTAIESSHTVTIDPDGNNTGTNYLDAVVALYYSCNNNDFLDCHDESGGGGLTTTYTFNGLTPGDNYLIRVYDYGSIPPSNGDFGICITHSSTGSQCDAPDNPNEDAVGEDYADLDWSGVAASLNYKLRYREVGGVWQYEYPSSSYFNVTGLQCENTYEWQVKSECTNGNSSSYTALRTFETENCNNNNCATPQNLEELGVGETYVDLDWSTVSNVDEYKLQIREVGESTWHNHYPSVSSYSIEDLVCGTEYEWHIRSNCENGETSDYSNIRIFSTSECPNNECNTPYTEGTESIYDEYATFIWEPVDDAWGYGIRWREVGSWDWDENNQSGYNYHVSNLDCGTTYEWQVRTQCDDDFFSDWSESISFSTMECAGLIENIGILNCTIYPNPNNGIFTIKLAPHEDNLSINIIDITGRLLNSFQVSKNTEYSESIVSIEEFSVGMYVVKISSANGKLNYSIMIHKQ